MKKTSSSIILSVVGALIAATPAFAATVSISPSAVNVTKGQTFTVSLSIDPQGVASYADKIELDYPAGAVQETAFDLSNGWMALTQPGYDSVDNGNGVLIKSAGYPGGISAPTVFGTVTFKALGPGNGTIKVGAASMAYGTNSQSAMTGSGATFTVKALAASAPARAVAVAATEKASIAVSARSSAAVVLATSTQTAAAAEAQAPAGSMTWVWIILAVAAIAIIGFFVYRRRRGSPRI